jgi:regulator of replication initiation timing
MSTGSLDILRSRVQSAIEETKILRAENERLKARLEESEARHMAVADDSTGRNIFGPPAGHRFDPGDIRRRLQGLLRRIDRLEEILVEHDR